METQSLYNAKDPKSIEKYARKLVGHDFKDVLSWNIYAENEEVHEDQEAYYANKARKGGLGNLLEERFFAYKANSDSSADFKEAGVELKVTPYEKKKDGSIRAGERLVLTMIGYDAPIDSDFYSSHLWEKCRLMLLIYYLRNKESESNLYYSIDYVKLFTPPKEDLTIIEQDYKYIVDKIQSGKAHEISEGDTVYLGACTKGKDAKSSTVPQYYGEHILARKRAFCLKNSYMTYVLNNYIKNDVPLKLDSILDSQDKIESVKEKGFEEYIVDTINQYKGTSDEMLCRMFDREYNNNKAQWIELAYRMLGIKSGRAEEFVKANISVKAIRIDEKGKMRESSPLPPFKLKELALEEWEESSLYDYLITTKFLIVVYRKCGDVYVLNGCQLWNMPYKDIDEIVQREWLAIQKVVKDGIQFTKKINKSGPVIGNNFPKKKGSIAIHIRPHTSKRYYRFNNGEILGDGTPADSDELPDGQLMPKQSFWLNNSYILSQLDENLKLGIDPKQ